MWREEDEILRLLGKFSARVEMDRPILEEMDGVDWGYTFDADRDPGAF